MTLKQAIERGKIKSNSFMLKRKGWEKKDKKSNDVYSDMIYFRNGELFANDSRGEDVYCDYKYNFSADDLTACDWSFSQITWIEE
jgi:hypothetical protein